MLRNLSRPKVQVSGADYLSHSTPVIAPIISVQERRRKGQRSLTNIIRIVSREWSDWLRKGPRRLPPGVGSNCTTDKKLSSTDTSKKERNSDAPSRREAISRGKEVALR
jgi:hypothetical protein